MSYCCRSPGRECHPCQNTSETLLSPWNRFRVRLRCHSIRKLPRLLVFLDRRPLLDGPQSPGRHYAVIRPPDIVKFYVQILHANFTPRERNSPSITVFCSPAAVNVNRPLPAIFSTPVLSRQRHGPATFGRLGRNPAGRPISSPDRVSPGPPHRSALR